MNYEIEHCEMIVSNERKRERLRELGLREVLRGGARMYQPSKDIM